jgi:hypothetical protein
MRGAAYEQAFLLRAGFNWCDDWLLIHIHGMVICEPSLRKIGAYPQGLELVRLFSYFFILVSLGLRCCYCWH